MTINWTHTAVKDLKKIYRFNQKIASKEVAQKIQKSIFSKTNTLHHGASLDQQEELLKQCPEGYRYLIDGNYKIIYFTQEHTAWITYVFDTRQNPKKLKK